MTAMGVSVSAWSFFFLWRRFAAPRLAFFPFGVGNRATTGSGRGAAVDQQTRTVGPTVSHAEGRVHGVARRAPRGRHHAVGPAAAVV